MQVALRVFDVTDIFAPDSLETPEESRVSSAPSSEIQCEHAGPLAQIRRTTPTEAPHSPATANPRPPIHLHPVRIRARGQNCSKLMHAVVCCSQPLLTASCVRSDVSHGEVLSAE